MNEDFNPGPASEDAPERAGDGLSGAFEELIQGRLADTGDAAAEPLDTAIRMPDAAAGPCPDLSAWALLLGNEAGPERAEPVNALLTHASLCGACAEKMRVLSEDLSPDESEMLALLNTASPEGRHKLAAQLARTPRQGGSARPASRFLWMGAGLAASLLIGVGLFAWWREANNPERLLAETYAHDRIFDLRMPGAGFAEVTPRMHLRGATAAHEPARLLEARDRIERHLEAAPDDPRWLELEARSDILEEEFDPAIDILDRLLAAGPVTASLLLDDASAYFQRGEATESETDRASALDKLQRADELAPGDPVVLFNEAVVMEDRGQLMNAVETWNRYLRFERDPRWLAEGRRRLQALEQELNQLKKRQ